MALVLGATRGIGRAIAEDLAAAGAVLVLPYYDWPDDCAALERRFGGPDTPHLLMKTDLREAVQIRRLRAAINERYGRLDILVNNIERGGMPVVHGPYTEEQWAIELDTTLKAKWWIVNETLALLRAAGGVVVNITSIAAVVGRSGPAGLIFNDGYAAANRAVSSFTETWARQAAPEVRVNELMIGFVESRHGPGTRGWGLLNEEERAAIRAHTLLGRTGRIGEVVAAVRFLIDAPFMTGSVLRLDGGYVLGNAPVPPMPAGEDDVDITL